MTVEPITVNYVSSDDEWQVTVTGRGQEVTGQAPGIIAARDRADQLIEKIAPEEEGRTAVHLLNGDALEFTTAYINARLGRTDGVEPASDALNGSTQAAGTTEQLTSEATATETVGAEAVATEPAGAEAAAVVAGDDIEAEATDTEDAATDDPDVEDTAETSDQAAQELPRQATDTTVHATGTDVATESEAVSTEDAGAGQATAEQKSAHVSAQSS